MNKKIYIQLFKHIQSFRQKKQIPTKHKQIAGCQGRRKKVESSARVFKISRTSIVWKTNCQSLLQKKKKQIKQQVNKWRFNCFCNWICFNSIFFNRLTVCVCVERQKNYYCYRRCCCCVVVGCDCVLFAAAKRQINPSGNLMCTCNV